MIAGQGYAGAASAYHDRHDRVIQGVQEVSLGRAEIGYAVA